jgi:hypothetical protein
MLADTNEEPRTIGETYAGAISNGSTRISRDSTLSAPGEIVAVAGMSPYRLGTALMRLSSEWHSGATPPPLVTPSAKGLRKQGVAADLAEAEARQLAARAADWQMQENMLRFQRMKSLPGVRAALLHFVAEKGWSNAQELVADTLRHFLAPACAKCQGRGKAVIPGTSRAVGKACRKCSATGQARLDHGGRGAALLSHIRSCTGQASRDMREGAHKLRRTEAQDREHEGQWIAHVREEKRRAEIEARADDAQDSAAIAAHFRNSFGRKRPVKGMG